MVWAIASQDPLGDVKNFVKQFKVPFPVLHDATGKVLDQYTQDYAFSNTVYPQEWLIGVDGTVVYFSNKYDADTLSTLVEIELAKPPPDDAGGDPHGR